MVEATVQMRDGTTFTTYARTFEGLFRRLEDRDDVVKVVGRTIKQSDMRQGKDGLNGHNKSENSQP